MPISKETAQQIAYAYREIDAATELLDSITEALSRRQIPDIRDAFGRHRDGLELGVPTGGNGHRLYNVPWSMARPIIENHIAQQKAIVAVLSERALIEATGTTDIQPVAANQPS